MRKLFIIALALTMWSCGKEEAEESTVAEYRYEFSNPSTFYIGYIEQATGNRINKPNLHQPFVVIWQQDGVKKQYACSGASYRDGKSTIKLFRNGVLLTSVTSKSSQEMVELKGDY